MSEARPHELSETHWWGHIWQRCGRCGATRMLGTSWDDDCPSAPAPDNAQDLFERALRSGGFDAWGRIDRGHGR